MRDMIEDIVEYMTDQKGMADDEQHRQPRKRQAEDTNAGQ